MSTLVTRRLEFCLRPAESAAGALGLLSAYSGYFTHGPLSAQAMLTLVALPSFHNLSGFGRGGEIEFLVPTTSLDWGEGKKGSALFLHPVWKRGRGEKGSVLFPHPVDWGERKKGSVLFPHLVWIGDRGRKGESTERPGARQPDALFRNLGQQNGRRFRFVPTFYMLDGFDINFRQNVTITANSSKLVAILSLQEHSPTQSE